MIINAVVLIVLGLLGYFTAEPSGRSMTAFIGPAVGIVLLLLSPAVKNNNSTATHLGVVLTAIVAIALATRMGGGNPYVIIMGVVSIIAVVCYIMDFIRRKKERESKAV
jgi:general stress protein CsbA